MSDEALVMVEPGHVADRDGVSKQAVTRIVRQLAEKNDLPVERDSRGRIVRFSLAHYDHVRGQFSSSARTSASRKAERGPGGHAGEASRDEALRQEAWLKVGREKLRRQEDLGQLVRVDRLKDSLGSLGREIQSLIARLPNRADDLALAVSKEGVHGLRTMLRQVAFQMNGEIADKLADIAEAAPESDPLVEDEDA